MNAALEPVLSDRQRAVLDVLRSGQRPHARAVDIGRITGAGPSTLTSLALLGFVERRSVGGHSDMYLLTATGRQAAHLNDPQLSHDPFGDVPNDKEKNMSTQAPEKPKAPAKAKAADKATDAPPVEDVTGKTPEPRVSKTKLARETAIRILKQAKKPMKMTELVDKVMDDDKVKAADIAKGTVSAQVNFELKEKAPRVVRTERATYAHVDHASK